LDFNVRIIKKAWERMESVGWDVKDTSLDPGPADVKVAHVRT
jgi:hypothetical protein